MRRHGVPLPDLDFAPTRPFFEAAARGELAIPRCTACARFVWYPRERCPACQAASPAWVPVSGRGTLFSYAVVRRALWKPFAEKAPYLTGLVALEEDPAIRLVTTFVDCAADELRMDGPVHAVFRPLRFTGEDAEVILPFFTPTRPR